MRKNFILTLIILTLSFINPMIELQADSKSFCNLITASEGTTANCNQYLIELENGSFEEGYIVDNNTSKGYAQINEDLVPAWNTTATDDKIELWSKSGYQNLIKDGDVDAIVGDQIVELNATQDASLYQDFATVPGQTIKIAVNHGGRFNNEELSIMVGEPNEYSAGDKYPTKGHENDIVATDIVNSGEWNQMAVLYTVPEGQTTTRIAFNSTSAPYYTQGNLIDNVRVGVDSIYDQDIQIYNLDDNTSYAHDYFIVDHVKHIYGDHLGEYIVEINLENFKNVNNIHVYDQNFEEIDLEDLNYFITDTRVLIGGNQLEDGYFTFYADSTLQEAGELSIESTIYYYSQLDVDVMSTGLSLGDYYTTKDIATIDTSNESPTISGTNIVISEEVAISNEQILEQLNVTIEDYEDGKNEIDLEMVDIFTTASLNKIDINKPGDYLVVLTGLDSQGSYALSFQTVTVEDKLPQISVANSSIDIIKGTSLDSEKVLTLTEAIGTEVVEADISDEITVDLTAVNTNEIGTYSAVLSVTDEELNQAQKNIEVNVVRDPNAEVDLIDNGQNIAPTITLTDYPQIDEETYLSEEQLEALFKVQTSDFDGSVQTLDIDSNIDYSTPGEYEIRFTAIDNQGLSSTITGTLVIIDLLPAISIQNPVLDVLIGNELNTEDLINGFGITATEITENDLINNLYIDTSEVNFMQSGLYPVTLTVVDQELNEVFETAYINVYRNTTVDPSLPETGLNTAPIITAKSNIAILEEQLLTEQEILDLFEVEVIDLDDNLEFVTVDISEVNFSTPGTYNLQIKAIDTDLLETTLSVELEIVDILPKISAIRKKILFEAGSKPDANEILERLKVTATEISKNDLLEEINVDKSEVQFLEEGEYPVTLNVSDEEGNVVGLQSYVTIYSPTNTGENTAPVITGLESVTIEEENILDENQLITLFEIDVNVTEGNLQDVRVDVENVDFTTPGTYPIVFTATDTVGLFTSFETNLVISDLLPTLETAQNVQISLGDNFTKDELKDLFVANASEISEGDLNELILVDDSLVNFDKIGEYPVSFSVSDQELNTITKVVTLTIEDNEVILNNEDESYFENIYESNNLEAVDSQRTINEDQTTDLNESIQLLETGKAASGYLFIILIILLVLKQLIKIAIN